MSVVAEGVENKHQQELLVELECDYIQGYYFYKPLNLDEYKQLI
jgi:EAL domain-containing protein (putative c-di-GMP-specific phosphodiesterase class I)